ncbi:MAG: aldo/keto reductase [Acidobacteria bacterium]|nr:aldo/keto reductase [Acidobacteriota bacterium]
MRYKLLGNSGLRVSELCLGTMTFGEDWGWGAGGDESRAMYDAFREAGGNFIDTANIYTNGSSETLLGEFIQGHRDSVVLATKFSNSIVMGDPNAGGNNRKAMIREVESSLKRLKTDYIDLYWMHIWDKLTPVEEVMRAFDDLVSSGKVLYIGISDAPAWYVARANTLAELRGWRSFVGLQIEYSLIERTPEEELIPMAKELGLTVTPWSPLAGGILAGKYLDMNSDDAKSGRFGSEPMQGALEPERERKTRIASEVVTIAAELGVSPSQVALAWIRHKDPKMVPIIGTRRLSQLHDNLASLNVNLSDDQMRRLNEVSAYPPIFPNNFFQKDFVPKYVYGGLKDQID